MAGRLRGGREQAGKRDDALVRITFGFLHRKEGSHPPVNAPAAGAAINAHSTQRGFNAK